MFPFPWTNPALSFSVVPLQEDTVKGFGIFSVSNIEMEPWKAERQSQEARNEGEGAGLYFDTDRLFN